MDLHPPTAPLPEPFTALRRRDRDVDIVLLPAAVPPPGGSPGTAPAPAAHDPLLRLADLEERVPAVAGRWWKRLAPGAAPPAPRTTYGPRADCVVVRARACGTAGDTGGLGTLAAELAAAGWVVRGPVGAPSGASDPADRCEARRGALALRVAHSPSSGLLRLEVCAEPLTVGPDRARRLVRGSCRTRRA